MSIPRLAKLTRPSASGLAPRRRLFRELDSAAKGRLIWVSGGAGAGKTSLVSTWLEARRVRHAWYQVDVGDDDPATLFHYLELSVHRLAGARKRITLPRLTPDRLLGLDVFTRRFFEALFAAMASPSILVFDDCHSVGPAAVFHQMLAGALSVVPEGLTLACLSREMPPVALARWCIEPGYRLIGPDDLRVRDAEARVIARSAGASCDVARVNRVARGWAAGLKLLLRALRTGVPFEAIERTRDQPLFDYFAGEVFEKSDASLREFLLRTALPPRNDADLAKALTGNPEAANILERLHRNGLFTDRRTGKQRQAVYEFHPLFRSFLLARAAHVITPDEWGALARVAATRLEVAGEIEDAATLLIDAKAWPELTTMIRVHAPDLMAQGRFATLRGWTAAIPAPHLHEDPWLLYWHGASRELSEPLQARRAFERAYAGFQGAGDLAHGCLALAGILRTYFTLMGDQFLDAWVGEMEKALALTDVPKEVEVQLIAAANAIVFARPASPMAARLVERGVRLFWELDDLGDKLAVALSIASYNLLTGDFARCEALGAHLITRLDVEAPWAWPMFGAWFGATMWQQANHERAYVVLEKGLRAAREHGFPVFEVFLQSHIAFTALSAGDLDRAEHAIEDGFQVAHKSRPLELCNLRSQQAALMFLRRHSALGIDTALENLAETVRLGSTFGAATFGIQLGQMLMLEKRHAEARRHLEEALAFGRAVPSPILQFQALLALAWSHFDTHEDDEALALLRTALAIGAQHDYMNAHPLWLPRVMAQLCERALGAGIETDYVRRLIVRRHLMPESRGATGWPWAVEVRALGGFALHHHGDAVAIHGKTQRKVLDLLKVIVALGGQNVSVDAIQDALWPDAEGHAAKGAFDVTLHRLRKLLGDEQTVLLSSGRVGLNPRMCHVDVWAFERAADTGSQSESTDFVRLYRGHFLAGEPEYEWVLAARKRLSQRFSRAVRATGDHLERVEQFDAAMRLYRHAIDLNPTDEEIYRRWITLRGRHAARGDE